MKTIRYILSLGATLILLFIGSGFAYGPDKADLISTNAPIVSMDPTMILLLGISLTIIGSFGGRRLIKKS